MAAKQKNTNKAKWQGSKWIRKTTRKRIYIRDQHTCVYCNHSIYDDPTMTLTLDHIVAREFSGTNKPTNLVTCCAKCNCSKQHKTVKQFITYLKDQGVKTDGIARRVRNATRRTLPKLQG